ncbi:hypothetical protein [Zavarzinia compransoris]|uniref:Uncharacterized protein n=1 Tax=Zavarzinia compransoris TaxID=1264899 RepID=A0A317DYN5_9PROT|nr:hypothetical protein [Zavarzinia compransoris]PWR18966.1 hypothetical protein DKG75_18530 [Zavarzinia compransoris]TDP48967.1 hypothetical protein DES42_101327 [Zavarzinia compransoris]
MIIELKQNDRVLATDVVTATETFEARHLRWAERKARELALEGEYEVALKTLAGSVWAHQSVAHAA